MTNKLIKCIKFVSRAGAGAGVGAGAVTAHTNTVQTNTYKKCQINASGKRWVHSGSLGSLLDADSRLHQRKSRLQKIQDRQPRLANLDEFRDALSRRDRVAAWLKFTDIAVDPKKSIVRQLARADYINLLSLLAHHQISSWRLVLDTMKTKSQIPIDKEIYELYLKNVCKLSLFKEATEILAEMRSVGQPSISTYNIILNMYAKKSLKDMMAFLELMKRSCKSNGDEHTDLCLDVSTHNIVIKAYLKNREYENALNYWNSVSLKNITEEGDTVVRDNTISNADAEVKANAVTLSILIKVADGLNDMSLLSSLYKQALDNALLDKFIYSDLLSIYSRRNMLEDFNSISSTLYADPKVTLDLPLYTILINHTLATNSAYKAFLLLKEMKEKAIYPDIPLIQAVTDGLVKTGLVEEAFAFVEECRDQGYLITHLIYRTVLKGLVAVDDVDKVGVVYERIMGISTTTAVPTVLFNLVLECASNNLSVDFFQKVWKDLEKGGSGGERRGQGGYKKEKSIASQTASPNLISYEIALKFYMKIRNVDAAIDILTKLSVLTPPSPSSTATTPISSQVAVDLIRLAIQSHEYAKAAYIVSFLAKYGGGFAEKVLDGPDGPAYYAGFCRLIEELWRQAQDEELGRGFQSPLVSATDQISLWDREKKCFLVLDVYKYLLLPLYPKLKPNDNVYMAVMGAFTVVKDLVGVVRTWSVVEKESNEKDVPISAGQLDMLLKAALALGSKKTAVALLKMVLDQNEERAIQDGGSTETQKLVTRKKYLVSPDGYETCLVLAAKFTDGKSIPYLLLDLEKSRKLDGRVWRLIHCAFQERKLQCGQDKIGLKETMDAIAYVNGFVEEFYPEMIDVDPVMPTE